jgi:hypothetical protein
METTMAVLKRQRRAVLIGCALVIPIWIACLYCMLFANDIEAVFPYHDLTTRGKHYFVDGHRLNATLVQSTFWCITVGGALIVASLKRRNPKSMPGFCETCGYDLRATPERCPECGIRKLFKR